MVNYANTKIYTIRNNVNDKVFVGYTTSRIAEGFNSYKQQYKKCKLLNKLTIAFSHVGLENFYVKLEKEVKCKTKAEVTDIVQKCIDEFDSFKNGYNYSKTRKETLERVVDHNSFYDDSDSESFYSFYEDVDEDPEPEDEAYCFF